MAKSTIRPVLSLCVSFSRTGSEWYKYLNFLHNSQWITFPIKSSQVLNSFCANLLHLLIMWSIVWSLSPHYYRDEMFASVVGCYWSSSDKSLQLCWTLPNILTDLCGAVVWTVSVLLRISSSTSLFSKFFGIVPRAPIVIGITVTFVFHSFFSYLAKSRCLSTYFFSLCWNGKVIAFSSFYLRSLLLLIIFFVISFINKS